MGNVHILFPSIFRDPIARFRDRFPGPWSVAEFDGGYVVLDSKHARLMTIETSAQARSSRLSRPQAFVLAHAIARIGCPTSPLSETYKQA